MTVVVFLIVVIGGAVVITSLPSDQTDPAVGWYLLLVSAATAIAVGISYAKGPKPKWRWGKKLDDDLHQDI